MACSKCGAPAVTHLRYSGQHLCREHFLRFFDKRAKAELRNQGRLPAGRVAVALSGGKDSVAALHFLRRLTADNPGIELVAVTVDEGIAGYRGSAIVICEEITRDWGIEWHLVKTEDLAGYTIDEYARGEAGPASESNADRRAAQAAGGRPACGPCGVFRRTGVNRVAQETGAAAVVTGHNLDDQAQTVLMNHLQGDLERLARLAPHTAAEARDGLTPRLLPFRSIPEKEVFLYALLHGLPVHDEAECPYAARAQRFVLRDMLLALEDRSPGTRHSLVKGQERLKPLLRSTLEPVAMQACRECSEPTSGAVCKVCQWKA